jgi:hypothetical protein
VQCRHRIGLFTIRTRLYSNRFSRNVIKLDSASRLSFWTAHQIFSVAELAVNHSRFLHATATHSQPDMRPLEAHALTGRSPPNAMSPAVMVTIKEVLGPPC